MPGADPALIRSKQWSRPLSERAERRVGYRDADPIIRGSEIITGVKKVEPAVVFRYPDAFYDVRFPLLVVLNQRARTSGQPRSIVAETLHEHRRGHVSCYG